MPHLRFLDTPQQRQRLVTRSALVFGLFCALYAGVPDIIEKILH